MASIPSTLSDVLAKGEPRQTLVEHSQEAVRHLLGFVEAFPDQVGYVARAIGVSRNELISRLFATVWLHDIGKASRDFQRRIHQKERVKGIGHPLLSVPYALAAAPPIGGISYEAIAVMSHHTPYYAGLYGRIEADLRPLYLWGAAQEFYRLLPSQHLHLLGHEYPFSLSEPIKWESRVLVAAARDAIWDCTPPEAREVFGLFTAAIHYSDWLSSGHRTDWRYSVSDLSQQVQTQLRAHQGTSVNTFASKVAPGIQSRAEGAKGHLLLTAPTGAGKTEAALLWASNRPISQRLTYLLPTRVTSSAMYERIQRYAGPLAGLAHGTAGLIIGEQEGYDSQAFQSRLYHFAFMQPATVGTVDQLLLAKFNCNHWGLIDTNVSQSAVIFDEIHAYDLFTLGLILNAAGELAERGARLCFMSATMPDFLREALVGLLQPFGQHTIVDCPEAMDEQRHVLYVRQAPLEDAVPAIVASFQRNLKVLVVANTVDVACRLYKLVRDEIGPENAMLFHSRFIERDRRRLEKRIASENERHGGFVAVVTQIVEVSLDIDYDIMFSQVAPVDALVQRCGRVNRKGRKGTVPVYIFRADEGSGKVYGAEVLSAAWNMLRAIEPGRPIRQSDVLDWVRVQYPTEHWLRLALESAEKARQNVHRIRRQLWEIQTLRFSNETEALWKLAKSRQEQFPSFEVVPECFRSDVSHCSHPAQRQDYVVRVPAYLIQRKAFDEEMGILFADLDYDPEFGAGHCH